MFSLNGCKSDTEDFNPTGTTTPVASVAENTTTYKTAGYSGYKTECYDSVLSGMDVKAQNYLFIKASTAKSPLEGFELAAGDATADLDMVLISYTYLACDAQPVLTQVSTAIADVTTDVAAATVATIDNKIKARATLKMHISDITFTPGAGSIVYSFLTATNSDLSTDVGDSITLKRSDTNYGATGFCGLTDWAVGKVSNPRLPGEVPTGDTTADSYRDMLYASSGGLGACALPPKGDASHDISTSASQAYGQLTTKTYVTDVIGFDTTENFDLGHISTKDVGHFTSELNTIWLTGFSYLGSGAYDAVAGEIISAGQAQLSTYIAYLNGTHGAGLSAGASLTDVMIFMATLTSAQQGAAQAFVAANYAGNVTAAKAGIEATTKASLTTASSATMIGDSQQKYVKF